MSKETTSYKTRVQSMFPELKKKNDEKISRYIEENPKEIIHMTVAEASEACGVSEAAMVRYSQKLGYKGYQAMKISIAQEAIAPEQQIYGQLAKDDTIKTIVDKIIDSDIQALKSTSEVLDRNAINDAVNLILNCKTLLFYGIGGSGSVALDGQHKFLKIGYLALAYTDSNLQAMSASVLSANDVVIAISHSGASKDILTALHLAHQAGAKTIVITNYAKSPILEEADIVLNTFSTETTFSSDALSSRIAELSIIDMLYIGVSFKNYEASYENIMKTRKALDETKI
ncbi:MurR/RpiR family transcriptional regulator [Hominiventricola aquisgranensis]|uniref:MurR/RpiR family transcriptional regulator n=1 Tax=Hominiventricola aquisgranensis TaxID=3133164 RepID=A0ABV1I3D9_9FIRM